MQVRSYAIRQWGGIQSVIDGFLLLGGSWVGGLELAECSLFEATSPRAHRKSVLTENVKYTGMQWELISLWIGS